jgi:hypothetical protein
MFDSVTRYHSLASFNWIRYSATNWETWGFESLREHQLTGPSSNGKDVVLRRLKFQFDSERINHEPVADRDATDCLSVPCGFDSRRRNQFIAGDSNGSEACPTNKFYRVRLPGPLPFWVGNTSGGVFAF